MNKFAKILILTAIVAGCASTGRSGVLAKRCGDTPIKEADYLQYGFNPSPGKIVVLHVTSSWCPFCEEDIKHMAEMYKNKTWSAENVEVWLLTYSSKNEDKFSFGGFKDQKLPQYGFPAESTQAVYVEKNYKTLLESKSSTNQPLFLGWEGLPFAIVFGKDGRLAYRGHFTMDDGIREAHYKFITDLQKEICLP